MKYLKLFESHSDSDLKSLSKSSDESPSKSIESICREYGIQISRNWTRNGDGTIDVDGGVFIGGPRIINRLPLKFGKVTGWFFIEKNKLTTLEGCPQEVGGEFNCSDNQLITLEGAPIKVGGDFDCSNNKLVSLEGGPKEVGGHFWCYDNKLTSLKGSPSYVNSFGCNDNKLITLEGAPRKVGGDFLCRNNKLTSLLGGPIYVGEGFDCEENNLISLEGGPTEFGEDFDFYCEENPIWNVYELFPSYKSFMDSLDYNYLRGKSIDKRRFEEALDEVGLIKMPKRISGWKWI
jgi:hypothetical protein